ncbi:HAMP domain-containing sensor histidine kinase [Cytobacillus sp. IB215316]|uniref:HAMP domain-containing sensor histidine kinase n=1 Tax=Cytobacillus sp. IB215316 TaxID=3097354 RepID=UPI002A0DD6CB|nr:HAMP domain-containing sensor histidine kinase [Cytobacillus sp. IB215316]MDX8361822.1 HAMP domain-containing sensor histidine kinase [Cytobacillus sp. IB215316]
MIFFLLYFGIVNERIQSETDDLFRRGISHRDVLEKNFDELTIKHVALMESEAVSAVVITNAQFQILEQSDTINSKLEELIKKSKEKIVPDNGELLEKKWKTEEYLATIHPVIFDGQRQGYVFMFSPTQPIRSMINGLTYQFLFIGLLSLLLSIATIFFLSRFITKPLIDMKEVTEKISTGQNNVFLKTNRDDELGELAKAIHVLSNRLERLKKERNEFLSSISHELRTPLAYLKGYADILQRTNLTSKERNDYLKIIEEEATHVVTLVKDLFDLAQIDENVFKIQQQAVHLHQFLSSIVEKFRPAYSEKEIHLKLVCPEKLTASFDPNRFDQVISNLLDNALKHSASHSSVEINAKKQDGKLTIIVKDEGEGIPANELPFIWDRLYRVEKSRSRSTGGTGLGLSIVKGIVDSHGGEIDVQSKIGEGTIFKIVL